jgi:hypothetical protein
MHCATTSRYLAASQPLSPLFRLPAELRVAIYEYLTFPPLVNDECRGLILSCRKAKQECEETAISNFSIWIATFKRDILPACAFEVRILLPSLAPIKTSLHLNTTREVALVFPSRAVFETTFPSSLFFGNLRVLNPIFCLWLDKLTLHFRGPIEGGKDVYWIRKTFRRLQFILEGGLTYAHDPLGQAQEKRIRKFSNVWDHWQPEPSFIRKLVISWDITEQGLSGDEFVHLEGVCKRRPTQACTGRRLYRVMDDASGLLGEYMSESACRFKPSESEDRAYGPALEHNAECFKCHYTCNYRRYVRGLPINDDERRV